MRWLAAVLAAVTPFPSVAQGRITGHVTVLEKDNKPSPDLGDAVIWLEGGGAGALRPGVGGGGTFQVAITDKTYAPHVLALPVGSSVSFPNHDPFNHNVFSVSDSESFDLGLYGRGEAKSRTFTHPGLVRVFCNVHPRMVAYLHVMATRFFTQPAGDGSFALAGIPPGDYRLHVWHERSPTEVVKEVTVAAGAATEVAVTLNARGYKWQAHKNKYGEDYPTNEGRERY
jgi:plastocyanin